MTIAENLIQDMKTSMKAGDADRTSVVRLLRGAIKNEEIKVGQPLDDAQSLKVVQREAKQRRDSMDAYRDAGRDDLVAKESAELTIIQEYLPEALSETDLAKIVDEVVAEQGADNMQQMGAVIGAVMKRVGASAEGGAVSKLVKEKLSA